MANVVFPFPFPEHLIALMPEMFVAVAAMALLLIDLLSIRIRKSSRLMPRLRSRLSQHC